MALRRLALPLLLAALWAAQPASAAPRAPRTARSARPADLVRLRQHLRSQWRALRRDPRDVLRASADPKLRPGRAAPVYVSRREDVAAVRRALTGGLPEHARGRVEVKRLPSDPTKIGEHGLLYVPNPYVVPGGRFNEQFGWDSYFIQRGMLRDHHVELPRQMTENLLYEVQHYGKVLNANRTYALGRSQPPLLSRMVLDVFDRTHDKGWLERSRPSVEQDHRYWTQGERRTPKTGLSRYVDEGRGPAPEVLGAGHGEYDRAKEYFRALPKSSPERARNYDERRDRLTATFFENDRAMRASGFDTSNRFGAFGAHASEYNPVDLNSLLYRQEVDLAQMHRIAGRPREAARWEKRAESRRQKINALMWDEQRGMYFDYHVPTGKRSGYAFAATFFPLWAGVATPEQAARVVKNLPRFERPGGLAASTEVTGHQWDAPFGWAPLAEIAVGGLRRYGYAREANRISVNFLSMVLKEFNRRGEVLEKYDVEHRDGDVTRSLRFGYTTNEVGFGWTNGAFIDLYAQLPASQRKRVLALGGVPLPGAAPRAPRAP